MAVTYPKVLKPWRGFPSANVIHAIAARVKQDNPNPQAGQFALKQDIARNIGTLPKNAVITAVNRSNPAAFTGTVVIGSQTSSAGIAASADVVATGAASVPLGALAAVPLTEDTPVYIVSTAAAPATGEINITIQFYIHRD